MIKKIFLSGVLIVLVSFIAGAEALALDSKELLTAQDIEEVTGIQEIKSVPKNPQMGAGGDLNFAQQDGTIILIAMIQDSSMYDIWKNQEGYFHASVPDLGDEAFEGPGFGEHRYILFFRKGKKAFSLSSFFNMGAGGVPYLSQDQLRQLANIIISRL